MKKRLPHFREQHKWLCLICGNERSITNLRTHVIYATIVLFKTFMYVTSGLTNLNILSLLVAAVTTVLSALAVVVVPGF